MTPGNSSTEESRNGKETAERSSSEDMGTLIEIEGENGTDGEGTDRQLLGGKGIRPGTQMLATHRYKKNPDGPVGNELDLSEGETLVYLMKHDDNDHWWLAENGKGQVGYVPAAYLMIILDETLQEEDSDTRKEGQGKGTDGTKMGGGGGDGTAWRKTYSAAVIDGFKRNSTIYVGDSIVRKTDTRLSRGEDVVVCLPGARIEHVTERVEQIMGRGYEGSILAVFEIALVRDKWLFTRTSKQSVSSYPSDKLKFTTIFYFSLSFYYNAVIERQNARDSKLENRQRSRC